MIKTSFLSPCPQACLVRGKGVFLVWRLLVAAAGGWLMHVFGLAGQDRNPVWLGKGFAIKSLVAIFARHAVGFEAVVQLELLDKDASIDLPREQTMALYSKYYDAAKNLMTNKNHDYGEAWRSMRVSSYTDLILMKIHRTKQIEDNKGQTKISEGVDANYYDMINYSVFALIKLVIEKND